MKYKLLYSPEALDDLDEIWDYILSELGNAIAAENTVARIMNDIELLCDFPESGTPLQAISRFPTAYRSIVSGNYRVFYSIKKETVYIVRILYGRRDYLRILFE